MPHIIIADNQAISRFGIYQLLSKQAISYQSTECTNKEELVIALREHTQAVIILDYTLFNFLGIDDLLVLAERYPRAHWLLFSDELSPDFLQRALCSATNISVVMKDASQEEL
ncbi:MAG TPA: DNA-binding response regulator, partial [Paludibacteraceae bacterium]|nr:DNA-binding response regulator [Paludibacteraceae bacterium]